MNQSPFALFSRDYTNELKRLHPDYQKQITGQAERKFVTVKDVRTNVNNIFNPAK